MQIFNERILLFNIIIYALNINKYCTRLLQWSYKIKKGKMLTTKQLKLFKFLNNYFKDNEVMPTFIDMMKHMNIKSKSGIFNMLGYIEWKGYIKREPSHARAIQIIKHN